MTPIEPVPSAVLRSFLYALFAAAVVAAYAHNARAQAKYPNHPIRLLVPFAAGGGIDVFARLVGQKVSEKIGQPIVVESKPGAGGAIATNELMRSDPDGYTLMVTTSAHATLPTLSKLAWHPSIDFTPIASIYSYVLVMTTNNENAPRFRTLPEFLNFVRSNPGKINWGSSGIGGAQHLAGALFSKIAGVDMVHVSYRGNGPMLLALMSNDVQLVFDAPTILLPQIQQGKLVPIAVAGDQRLPKLPDVPTVRESTGLDFSAEGRIFILGPKGMPESIQNVLNQEFAAAADEKDVRERLAAVGNAVPTRSENTIASLKKHIDSVYATYGRLITEMGIKSE